jgi:nitric oxide reductase subunit C
MKKKAALHVRVTILVATAFAVLLAACGAGAPASTPTPAVPPTPTPEPVAPKAVLDQGKTVFLNTGCGACHAITGVSTGLAAPGYDDLYDLAKEILTSKEYKASKGKARSIREFVLESILDPNAYVYPKCPQGPCQAGTMPQNYKDMIRPEDMDALMSYLMSLRKQQ